VIVELKRDRLPREAISQAIDYASDVAQWNPEKLDEVCRKFRGKSLAEYLSAAPGFEEIDEVPSPEDIRILLVGFSVDEATARMVNWLSTKFRIPINALVLKYLKTTGGDEILARTMIIAEEVTQRPRKRITSETIPNYSPEQLQARLEAYLSSGQRVPNIIAQVLLPLALNESSVTRDSVLKELVKRKDSPDLRSAGLSFSSVSTTLSAVKYDFLRQVLGYDVEYGYQKTNFRIREGYTDLVRQVVEALENSRPAGAVEKSNS
jgi:hypothetical protein